MRNFNLMLCVCVCGFFYCFELGGRGRDLRSVCVYCVCNEKEDDRKTTLFHIPASFNEQNVIRFELETEKMVFHCELIEC